MIEISVSTSGLHTGKGGREKGRKEGRVKEGRKAGRQVFALPKPVV